MQFLITYIKWNFYKLMSVQLQEKLSLISELALGQGNNVEYCHQH